MVQPSYIEAPAPPMAMPVPERSGGFLSRYVGPVVKLGGTVATLAGHPEIGIPLRIAGGAASGSSGGFKGAAIGGGIEGIKAALPSIIGNQSTPTKEGASEAKIPPAAPGKEATVIPRWGGS